MVSNRNADWLTASVSGDARTLRANEVIIAPAQPSAAPIASPAVTRGRRESTITAPVWASARPITHSHSSGMPMPAVPWTTWIAQMTAM
jgi:hypothetical protein